MMIISKFETTNFKIDEATSDVLSRLVEIQNSWHNQELLTGGNGADESYFQTAMTSGHLPPNGKKENYQLYSIRSLKSKEIFGILELYHGYPDKSTIWIGQFVIDKKHQQQGIGKEIIAEVRHQAVQNGFSKISIGVHLKNWPALRFWSANGFDKIRGIFGDKEYGIDKFSVVSLECDLGAD